MSGQNVQMGLSFVEGTPQLFGLGKRKGNRPFLGARETNPNASQKHTGNCREGGRAQVRGAGPLVHGKFGRGGPGYILDSFNVYIYI